MASSALSMSASGFSPLMSACPTASSYVRDGLVAMFDAEWNAGEGLHDAEAVTWRNLVSGSPYEDATFAPDEPVTGWTGNALLLPGIRGGAASRIAVTSDCPGWSHMQGDGFTLEVCGGLTPQSPGQTNMWPFLASIGNGGSRIIPARMNIVCLCDSESSTKRRLWHTDMPYVSHVSTFTIAHPVGYSERYVYVAGASVPNISKQSYSSTADANMILHIGGQFYTLGETIHCVRVYSRALTAVEVEMNYAVDRRRFDLP